MAHVTWHTADRVAWSFRPRRLLLLPTCPHFPAEVAAPRSQGETSITSSRPQWYLWLLEKTRTRTLDCSMFSQCLNPLFRTFLMMILLFKKRAKKACIGKPIARQREREKGKRRFYDQCCRVDVKEKSTEQYSESFSSDSQKILFWWMRFPRKSSTKSSTSYSWWKFRSKKIIPDWVQHGDPEFGTKKFRIRIIRVTTWALKLKDDNYWKSINMQIKLDVREYICAADWGWRTIFIKKLPRNWKIERRCYQDEISEKQQSLKECPHAAWSGITNSESILLRSLLTEQLWRTNVPHQALITLSSRKPSREVGMPRNTRENMSIPGNVFWSSTCSTRPWRITQWFKKFGDIIGVYENRRNRE